MTTTFRKHISLGIIWCLMVSSVGCSSRVVLNTKNETIPLSGIDRIEGDTLLVLRTSTRKIPVSDVRSITTERSGNFLPSLFSGIMGGFLVGELAVEPNQGFAGLGSVDKKADIFVAFMAGGVFIGLVAERDSKLEMAGYTADTKRNVIRHFMDDEQ